MEKIVTRKIKIIVCDYCKKEPDNCYRQCAVCGKDICDEHTAQDEEDGSICVNCGKKGYEIVYYDGEGVGVEKGGKEVDALYL